MMLIKNKTAQQQRSILFDMLESMLKSGDYNKA